MPDAAQGFHIFPAIDVLDGACVRLLRGDYAQKTEYSKRPRDMAERWIEAGTKWLHVVDLNGAKTGEPANTAVIAETVAAAQAAGVRVQIGGGIRTLESLAHWLELGVTRCIIGTAALDTAWMESAVREFGSEAIVAGLDGRGGQMALRGWVQQTELRLVDVAETLYGVGVRYALVTDVQRDGTLSGANLALAAEIQAVGMNAIASGGIRDLTDVLAAKTAGLAGAIAGRSIYDGTLDLREALEATMEVEPC